MKIRISHFCWLIRNAITYIMGLTVFGSGVRIMKMIENEFELKNVGLILKTVEMQFVIKYIRNWMSAKQDRHQIAAAAAAIAFIYKYRCHNTGFHCC